MAIECLERENVVKTELAHFAWHGCMLAGANGSPSSLEWPTLFWEKKAHIVCNGGSISFRLDRFVDALILVQLQLRTTGRGPKRFSR